jgi:hypothetical protein
VPISATPLPFENPMGVVASEGLMAVKISSWADEVGSSGMSTSYVLYERSADCSFRSKFLFHLKLRVTKQAEVFSTDILTFQLTPITIDTTPAHLMDPGLMP